MPRANSPIYFSSGIPSNFHVAPFSLSISAFGHVIWFPTNEHCFQAHKALGQTKRTQAQFLKISNAETAAEAKALGRKLLLSKRALETWDNDVAVRVMFRANLAKFQQNDECREWLASTGSRALVEHRRDKIWGDNMDGTGQNLQGKILELVRAKVCR